MSIRWVTSLLGLLLTVTIMVTAGLSWNVYSSFTKMVEADVQYLNLMQVSRELLQSSYDLTRKAREYVNTGDEASERAYYDILAQRSGRVPRKSSLAPGETISLPSLLERYGASRGDMEFLATALRRSVICRLRKSRPCRRAREKPCALTVCTADRTQSMWSMPPPPF